MKHHTTNPTQRAADIAEAESERIYQLYGPTTWPQTWLDTFAQLLFEINGRNNDNFHILDADRSRKEIE